MSKEEIGMLWLSSNGSVRNIINGPPGATYASEMAKQDEINKKNPNYVPSWNPGKEVNR